MLNRIFLASAAALAVAGGGCVMRGSASRSGGPIRVTSLSCEYLTDPLGIDTPRPRLAWALESEQRDQRQTAYRIVAEGDGGLRWDSGRVASSQQAHVRWGGPPLASGQRVTWRVRVWDRDGRPSELSAPATFEMGLLRPEDWRGRWIAAEAHLPEPVETMPLPDRNTRWIAGDDAALDTIFRASFTVPAGRRVTRARAVFAAEGDLVASINGREALRGRGVEWLQHALVTALVRPGVNEVAVAVHGAGARLLGRVVVDAEGGAPIEVATGAVWTPGREVPPPHPDKMRLRPTATPAPFLRRAFTVTRPVARARVHVAGAGYAELHLDGAKVSDHALDPGFTRFDRRLLYVTHDVTDALKPGAHVVGVVLGNGFYNQHAQDVWDFHLAPWRNTPRARVDLRVTYADGTSETVASDDSWQVATGPILLDGVRNGEVYDARLERPGWDAPGDRSTGWRPAVVVDAPGGVLSAQMFPPIRVTETLAPARITEPRPGVFVVDFGQNTAGWAQLTVSGPAGARVKLRYGEKVAPDGSLDRGNIDTFVQQGPFQTDEYVLSGHGTERWEPRFTYHGFQYVEVTGFPGRPTAANLAARVAHTAFAPIGRFQSSSPLLDRLWKATTWSYRANFYSIPTDCPHREKNGWMADAHLATEQALLGFDSAAIYGKWLRDIRDEQRPTGELPGIVPTGGWGYQWGNGPAWDSALFLVPWYLYTYLGDRDALTDSYEHFKRYVDYVGTRDYLARNPSGWLGDWVPARDKTPEAVTHAGYHALDARITAHTARLLGRADEAARYDAVAAQVKAAFATKYLDRATGKVAGGQQTALATALMHDLVDGEDRARVLARLVEDIERKGGHLDTGVLGAKYLPWVLTAAGRADLFYRTAAQNDFPSWGDWVRRGATTLWEDWGGGSSRNHIFFGDVTAWFYRALAGINPDPQAPGFERILFRPELVGDLTAASGETRTLRGRVASAWTRKDGVLTWRVSVPVNSTALAFVPAPSRDAVRADGGRFVRSEDGRQVFDLGSGDYTFVVGPAR